MVGSSRLPGPSKVNSDFALAGLFGLDDVPVIEPLTGAVLLEGVEGEDDVFGGHRLAVVPARVGTQAVFDVRKIIRMGHLLGQEAVGGGDLVLGLRDQPLVDQRDAAGDGALHSGHDDIEIVEGADRDLAHHAILRGVRIDVIEALEVGGILDVAEHREGVPPGRRAGGRRRGRAAARVEVEIAVAEAMAGENAA